jgi:hypothetical protein
MRAAVIAAQAMCLLLGGCGRAPGVRSEPDSSQSVGTRSAPQAQESLPLSRPPGSVDTSSRIAPVDVAPEPRPTLPQQVKTPLVSVPDLLASDAWVGTRVRVHGTCIGYSRVLASGPQPRTRSDWQLMSDSTAIWVTGPYPAGCGGASPAPAPDTFAVEVAEDTLASLAGRPARPRRYLIFSAKQ